MRQRFNSVEDFFFFSFGLNKGHTTLKGLLLESGDILQLKRSFSARCPTFFTVLCRESSKFPYGSTGLPAESGRPVVENPQRDGDLTFNEIEPWITYYDRLYIGR